MIHCGTKDMRQTPVSKHPASPLVCNAVQTSNDHWQSYAQSFESIAIETKLHGNKITSKFCTMHNSWTVY